MADPSGDSSWSGLSELFEARRKRGPLVHIPTGIAAIDRMTGGGFPYGSLITAVGLPDSAKTLFLLDIGCRYSEQEIKAGLLCVDEEPQDILCRLVQRAGYSREQFEDATDGELAMMERSIRAPLKTFDAEKTIEDAAEAMAAIGGGYLGIDSLQTVSCRAVKLLREPSERQIVALNTMAARRVSIQHRLVVVATSESNRDYARNVSKGANPMTAGAESRAIEYRARCQVVLSSHSDTKIRVDVPKNKLGAKETFYLDIDKQRQKMTEGSRPVPTKSAAAKSREEQREESRQGKVKSDREAAVLIMTKHPEINARDFRLKMRNAVGAGSDRSDAARDWWLETFGNRTSVGQQ
jgi:KaiC/GvpD/RAD55 family RecA-like ATPase